MMSCNNDEEKITSEKIRFDKLGDAFRYGMACELPNVIKDYSRENGTMLFSSLSYMYLNGLISSDSVYEIAKRFFISSILEKELDETIYDISKAIFEQLADLYDFDNMDELSEALNTHSISNWYFDHGMWLVDNSCRGAFVYEDYLYYISYNDGEYALSKIRTRDISDNETLDETENKKIIGSGFSEIYGFDAKLKRIYLSVNNQFHFYYVYDILTNSFVLKKGNLITIKDGIPYVFDYDNYLTYTIGNEIYQVNKKSSNEEYTARKDCLFVSPRCMEDGFFYPYCVKYDGRIVTADITDCREIIWSKLKEIAGYNGLWMPASLRRKNGETFSYNVDETLSIDNIVKVFDSCVSNSKKCDNKKYIILEEILEILKEYIDKNIDITKLMFVLIDANARLDTENEGFPSEKLYWRLKDIILNADGKVRLKEMLASENYQEFNMFLAREIDEKNVARIGEIGTFAWIMNRLETRTFDLKAGLVIGNIIMPSDISNVDGFVSYDSIFDRYIVNSNRNIGSEERICIQRDFVLQDENVIFVEQV